MSQSKLELKLEFLGTEKVLKGELMRIDAPFTIQKLMDKSPFVARTRGNIGREKNYWMVLVEIKKGAEGEEYVENEVGDIVYCPRQDAVFIIFDEGAEFNYPVYYLGEVTEGLEVLQDIRNGTNAKIHVNPLGAEE